MVPQILTFRDGSGNQRQLDSVSKVLSLGHEGAGLFGLEDLGHLHLQRMRLQEAHDSLSHSLLGGSKVALSVELLLLGANNLQVLGDLDDVLGGHVA